MAFPTKFLGIAIGWQQLGQKDSYIGDDGHRWFTAHSRCNRGVCIGKKGKKIFTYCPRCMIRLD